ncbi:hypothetical protein Ciccas_003153 [Cichlidogyrus casuarinus]|uniref:Cadherin domain-containing protein n=1 Tax=Cichlidogyrus casuarinus TaxID=1844966 RepID=A0ABD2QF67_9PLAT
MNKLPHFTHIRKLLSQQVTVTDADSVETNGQISCSEPEGQANKQPLQFEKISGSQGSELRYLLKTNKIFDRENGPAVRNSILVCSDGIGHNSADSLTATLTIPLHIEDENDNKPHFSEDNRFGQIVENSPENTRILQFLIY